MMSSPNPQSGALLAKIGAWMQMAQLVGAISTAVAMGREFENLSSSGVGDPSILSAAVGEALIWTIPGIGLAVIGMILVIIAATTYQYRARWLFWFLCLYGSMMIFSYMPPFGLFSVIYALAKRREFFPNSQSLSRASSITYRR
jgi:hypothetical protein